MHAFRSVVLLVCLGAPAAALAESGGFAPAVASELARAESAGLPIQALEAKAREGAAKGVAPERVAAYLAGLRAELSAVDGILGELGRGADRPELLLAAAQARRAGASAAAVREAAALSADLRSTASRALADLVAAGCTEAGALQLIRGAAGSARPVEALRDAVSVTFTLIAEGQSPTTAAERGAAEAGGTAWGAGGSKGKDPKGIGLDNAPGQQNK